MLIELSQTPMRVDLEFDTLTAGSTKEFEIELRNPSNFEFTIEKLKVTDDAGYSELVSYPRTIPKLTTDKATLKLTIPEIIDKPLKAKMKLEGYFTIV